jgi:Cleavage site for pathogenic type III effector avirulence factor Avr
VPKFGEWGDINSSPAGGGYTMQFENLKKKKEAAKATPIPIPAEPVHTPQRNAYRNDTSFLSRVSISL